MNKITSTLAGLALAAGLSVVPALAQDTGTPGNLFSPPGSFTFSMPTATTFTATGTNDTFNPLGSAVTSTVAFTLTGTEIGSTNAYVLNTLLIGSTATNGSVFTYDPAGNPLDFTFTNLPGVPVAITSLGADKNGATFNLVNPVPEASTVVSFGALLALGGLAVVLRRKGVKNVA